MTKFKASRNKPKQDYCKKLTKKVNRISRAIEKKHHETSVTSACANDVAVIKVSIPTVGDGDGNRTGKTIYSRDVEVRGMLAWTAGVNTSWSNGRILIFVDKNSNGVLPVIADVLTTNTMSSMANVKNLNRFKILYDRTFGNPQTHATIPNERLVYIKRKVNKTTSFLGTGVTASDLGANQLYMLLLSDNTTASANGPTFDFYLRLTYDDA